MYLSIYLSRHQVAHTWWGLLMPSCIGGDTCALGQFIVDLSSRPAAMPLLAQVLVAFSRQMELMFSSQSLKRKAPTLDRSKALVFSWCSELDGDGSTSREASPYVAAYQVNGLNGMIGCTNVSLATDKGWVSGLPLQDTIVVDGSKNYAVLAPPAVFRVCFVLCL